MKLTDVPQSGIYFQQGAILTLVVQLVDEITGLPLQLQEATAMTISLAYPDGTTGRVFSADLYTDGSDGMIAYTTQNDPSTNVDLTQWGLYHIQGQATLGAVVQPPSAFSDFYVKPNVSISGAPPIAYTAAAVIFLDANSVRWAMTVSTIGAIQFAKTPSGPVGALQLAAFVLKDADGIYWTVTVNINGTYTAVQGGTFEQSLNTLILTDAAGHAWVITISTVGVLTAT